MALFLVISTRKRATSRSVRTHRKLEWILKADARWTPGIGRRQALAARRPQLAVRRRPSRRRHLEPREVKCRCNNAADEAPGAETARRLPGTRRNHSLQRFSAGQIGP